MSVDAEIEFADAEELYARAYEVQNEKRDIEGAIVLYLEVIEQFPNSEEAGLAAKQLHYIPEYDPAKVQPKQDEKARSARRTKKVKKKFGGLRTVSGAFLLLAVVNGLGGGFAALMMFDTSAAFGTVTALVTAFSVVVCWALAESISVVIAIEENTRRAALAAEARRS